jgi:hypothetical protein
MQSFKDFILENKDALSSAEVKKISSLIATTKGGSRQYSNVEPYPKSFSKVIRNYRNGDNELVIEYKLLSNYIVTDGWGINWSDAEEEAKYTWAKTLLKAPDGLRAPLSGFEFINKIIFVSKTKKFKKTRGAKQILVDKDNCFLRVTLDEDGLKQSGLLESSIDAVEFTDKMMSLKSIPDFLKYISSLSPEYKKLAGNIKTRDKIKGDVTTGYGGFGRTKYEFSGKKSFVEEKDFLILEEAIRREINIKISEYFIRKAISVEGVKYTEPFKDTTPFYYLDNDNTVKIKEIEDVPVHISLG